MSRYSTQLAPLQMSPARTANHLMESPRQSGSPQYSPRGPRTLDPLILSNATHSIPKRAIEEISRYSKHSHLSRTGLQTVNKLRSHTDHSAVSKSFCADRLQSSTNGIGLKDIIASLNRDKVKPMFVPNLEKERANKFSPDKGPKQDFISFTVNVNRFKVAPNLYKPGNADGFLSSVHDKKIHFAYSKDAKKSVIQEEAKKQAWVPGSNQYTPNLARVAPRVIGTYTTRDITSYTALDATAHGMSVPANNLKLPEPEVSSLMRKAPATDFIKTKTIRFRPQPKTDLSPTSYKTQGAEKFTKPRNFSYSIPKEKLKTYITRHSATKSFVPAPNTYKIENVAKFITLGARKSYK